MNNLCAEIGYKSIHHDGEELCGDHVEVVERGEGNSVVVLADGLGSGVRASILSTLTSRIISTMMAAGLPLRECVSTSAATLPVSREHGVAYSTFTVLQLIANRKVEIIRYDNPRVIFLRDGELFDLPEQELKIEGKTMWRSVLPLQEDDCIIAMSDGCPDAGIGNAYNPNWKWEDIAEFMKAVVPAGYNAKTLAAMLVDACDREYGYHPADDATACVIRIRKREPMNLLFGPPRFPDDCGRMMSLFFSKEGKHIVCGGTTASIAAGYLGTQVLPGKGTDLSGEVPPTSEIKGVDLVTEGIITITKVIEYAQDVLDKNELYGVWGTKRDGASQICRLLFEEATDINLFVGRAVNPAHQRTDLPISFNLKMQLAEKLAECLQKMGKRVKVSYF